MLRAPERIERKTLLFLALLLLFHGAVQAQTQSGADTRVEKLYSDAKAAQGSGDVPSAIEDYKQIIALSPHLGPAYNNLGMLYLQQRAFPSAAEVLERGLRIDPHMASAAALLGTVYFEMGDYEHAQTRLAEALKLHAADANSRLLLAKSLMNLHQEDKAAAEIRILLSQQPNNQEAWALLGKAYLALSVQAMQKVSEIDPNSALSHELAGEVMQGIGNMDGALVEFKKAVDMVPGQPGIHEHLADAYWQLGDWDSAHQQYLLELENDPANCSAQWKAANALLEGGGSPADALESLNHALDECPGLVGAHVDRARSLIKLGRPADALQDAEMAEKSNPEDPTPHFLLAQIYRAGAHAAEAQREMQLYASLQQKSSSAVAKRAAEVESLKSNAH